VLVVAKHVIMLSSG